MALVEDKAWEKQTAPLLLTTLQNHYGGQITPADITEDWFLGTDFFWHRHGSCSQRGKIYRLAVRIRKAAFLKYTDDFTIREDRPQSHQKTELEKIREGEWANLYAYAFSDGDYILHWSLFRMSRFNPDAPFSYMPGFGPNNQNDTVTRIYRISNQPQGFRLDSVTPAAIPANQDQKRTAA
ncbi:hypothetical protein HAP94_00850 [Acidithiobacillus ferrivorans]|nr:hypothetical protein [Acidithiobacillus ferrivorans]